MTSLNAPLTGTSGQNVTITYGVTNESNNPTIFTSWVDSVYLAQGTALDPFALLIGRVQHIGAMAGQRELFGDIDRAPSRSDAGPVPHHCRVRQPGFRARLEPDEQSCRGA